MVLGLELAPELTDVAGLAVGKVKEGGGGGGGVCAGCGVIVCTHKVGSKGANVRCSGSLTQTKKAMCAMYR